MIHAPFNFVPLSDNVYFPSWADQISQDIPFFDGISGTIELTLTAKTPIFVRNGHTKTDAEEKNNEYNSFSNKDGNYFIPATSVKGCIRNVLEIMSFGKMCLDKNSQYAQREWDNLDLFPIKSPTEQKKIRCGWLKMKSDGSGYEIIDCGIPKRIGHTRIDEYLGKSVFENHFSKATGVNLTVEQEIDGLKFDPKTAVYKYKLLEGKRKLEGLHFTKDEEYAVEYKDNRVMVAEDGDIDGTIVLTGQPDKWKFPRPQKMTPDAGKFYEFVFMSPKSDAKKYNITEDELNHYKFIYADSSDWKYASAKIRTSGIPVFFRLENKKIKDWGLAFLYKLPYENTPYETLGDAHRSEKPDMAECMFGYTSKKKSLRGRVQFSALRSSNAEKDEKVSLVLSSPKASYYPIYIDQTNGQNGVTSRYKTYNDGRLKGWKRYHVRKNTWALSTGQDELDTVIYPLKTGAVFSGQIVFHNLKPEELGALLSALTFHNNQDRCFHQIGMAKPYGYGKVSLEITKTNFICGDNMEANSQNNPLFYMAFFEKIMNNNIGRWQTTDTIRQLFTLASNEVTNDVNFNYTYMTLDVENDNNEFNEAKKRKKYLQYYGQLSGNMYNINSLLLSDVENDVNKIINVRNERLDKINQAIEEQARLEEERKRQEEEKKRLEEERKRQEEEQARLEEERKKQEEAERLKQQKIQAGLSFLEETYELGPKIGTYKIIDFKGAQNRINQWFKKASKKQIDIEQFDMLETTLIRLAANPAKKEQKDWIRRDSNIWKYVESITSEEFTEKVFNKITS